MADHGFRNLAWQGRDGGVAVPDSGNAPSSAGGVDIFTIGGLGILPHSVSLVFYSSRTAPDVNIYLQWSKDGTIWTPLGGTQAQALFITNLAENLTVGPDETAIYTRAVQARWMRIYYESLTGSGGPTTMFFDYALIFGQTP